MAAYYIDMLKNDPIPVFVPCTFVPSKVPGKTLITRESDNASMVIEPDGSQVRWIAPGADNYDSPWTQADVLSGFAVFRSAAGSNAPPEHPEQILGVPHPFRMVA